MRDLRPVVEELHAELLRTDGQFSTTAEVVESLPALVFEVAARFGLAKLGVGKIEYHKLLITLSCRALIVAADMKVG